MTEPVTVFLPAAGLGERLRPITNHLPKPLLPVLGKPLIEAILDRLGPVCSGKIGINLHYQPELIKAWAAGSPYKSRIKLYTEKKLLGTGGALKNAARLLSKGVFLVHNADIIADIDFERLIGHHIASGNIATLATHSHPLYSNVLLDKKDCFTGIETPSANKTGRMKKPALKTAFTGIAVYSPEFLDFLPSGVSHVTDAWLAAAQAGHKVQALDFTGCYWNDLGTPAAYAQSLFDALSQNGETLYLPPEADCGDIEADGYIALERGCKAETGARLLNCILMPGAQAAKNANFANSIIGPDYVLELTEAAMQPSIFAAQGKEISLAPPDQLYQGFINPDGKTEAILIGFGGSDRRYFRIRDHMTQKSFVLMECNPTDPDFERHIEYTRFFASSMVPVPELIAMDWKGKRALFEDLGSTPFYSWLKLPRASARTAKLYMRIMEILAKLHLDTLEQLEKCPMLGERLFDYEHLRWETGYFLERFVNGLMGMDVDGQVLEREFHRLADLADSFPKTVVHRDFQSQNIMVVKGDTPRVIDYQGARIGPAAYDLASILWDPYHRLDNAMRGEILAHYIKLRKSAEGTAFSESAFRKTILPCRLQRHMQALGAYAFLAQVKGKKYFLKHVPEGLRLLKEDLSEAGASYPVLAELVQKIEYK
ncbi:MAG: phosphotransferase [Actinomycetota bacterium]|nr:phosphotransferase [Actinomycetota bacterium]